LCQSDPLDRRISATGAHHYRDYGLATGWPPGALGISAPALRPGDRPFDPVAPSPRPRLELDGNVQVDVEKHERPQQDSQEKGQELADGMDRVSVGKRYHYTNNYVQETE
jgi:hypothetical protein